MAEQHCHGKKNKKGLHGVFYLEKYSSPMIEKSVYHIILSMRTRTAVEKCCTTVTPEEGDERAPKRWEFKINKFWFEMPLSSL